MIHAEFTLRSVALDMDTKVDVLLPEDRHKTEDLRGKKYPVLYILHGMKNDNSSWLHLSNIFLMCRDLDLIVVMPSVQKSFYTNQAYGLNYYDYITEELPMKLKNYLPITDDWQKTYIMGESMGGYGTLKCALGKPQNYGKAVCLSGGNFANLFSDKPFMIGNFGTEAKDPNENDLAVLIERLKHDPNHKPEFAFYCGTEDFVCENCQKTAALLKEEVKDVKVSEEYWPGLHNFFFWNQAIPKALKFFGFEVEENSVI